MKQKHLTWYESPLWSQEIPWGKINSAGDIYLMSVVLSGWTMSLAHSLGFYHTVPYCCCETGICSESTLCSPVLHSPPVHTLHHHALLLNAAVASSRTRSKFTVFQLHTQVHLLRLLPVCRSATNGRLFIVFWLTRRSRVRGEKMRFGAAYSTSNKLLLVTRHMMATALQKCL